MYCFNLLSLSRQQIWEGEAEASARRAVASYGRGPLRDALLDLELYYIDLHEDSEAAAANMSEKNTAHKHKSEQHIQQRVVLGLEKSGLSGVLKTQKKKTCSFTNSKIENTQTPHYYLSKPWYFPML